MVYLKVPFSLSQTFTISNFFPAPMEVRDSGQKFWVACPHQAFKVSIYSKKYPLIFIVTLCNKIEAPFCHKNSLRYKNRETVKSSSAILTIQVADSI